ncbi:hypothetical protein Kpho01_23920 [Kitasatospora phosalacinea]|uniref:Uncharacterized protein n=1 Tax=Kitasatospora phosalacinea TaxID=2065 RepID=A0A9W6PFX7_9ACTN|nr:hypothetical protein Kpho01_23920 [Kitasatospora phosalacinea]
MIGTWDLSVGVAVRVKEVPAAAAERTLPMLGAVRRGRQRPVAASWRRARWHLRDLRIRLRSAAVPAARGESCTIRPGARRGAGAPWNGCAGCAGRDGCAGWVGCAGAGSVRAAGPKLFASPVMDCRPAWREIAAKSTGVQSTP